MLRRHVVYGVFHPDDDVVVYIGVTCGFKSRCRDHMTGSSGNWDLDCWIRALLADGKSPVVRKLCELVPHEGPGGVCLEGIARDIEKTFIREAVREGFQLFNKTHADSCERSVLARMRWEDSVERWQQQRAT